MRQLLRATITILLVTTLATLHAQDACGLLTTAQVAAAMGTPVLDGKSGQKACIWQTVNGNGSTYLSLHDDAATYERFKSNAQKTGHFVPVSGIGDEAFFLVGFRPTLYVKKGLDAYLLTVRFDDPKPEQIQTVEKSLAILIFVKNRPPP